VVGSIRTVTPFDRPGPPSRYRHDRHEPGATPHRAGCLPDLTTDECRLEGLLPVKKGLWPADSASSSQRDLNPCLHLERVNRADSPTSGGGRKSVLTWCFRFWSVWTVALRFSSSCGIKPSMLSYKRGASMTVPNEVELVQRLATEAPCPALSWRRRSFAGQRSGGLTDRGRRRVAAVIEDRAFAQAAFGTDTYGDPSEIRRGRAPRRISHVRCERRCSRLHRCG